MVNQVASVNTFEAFAYNQKLPAHHIEWQENGYTYYLCLETYQFYGNNK